MIEFPFKKWHSEKFGNILKPFIPVSIIGPKRKVDIFMLLDSGADISLIPYSIGKTIGMVYYEQGDRLSGFIHIFFYFCTFRYFHNELNPG